MRRTLAIVGSCIVAAAAAYFVLFSAPHGNAESERFVVPLDASSSPAVAEALAEEGFVRSAFVFRLIHPSDVAPGGYRLSKTMSAFEVSRTLSGAPYMKWVVIPEGRRKEEIADILAAALGWSLEEKEAWITVDTATDPDHFEGVYFPDTYLIPIDEASAAVADRLRAKFNEKFAPLGTDAAAQNIKWTTLLKIASLVQREAAGKGDMPLIAGIIWNRLLQGMKLDVDATIQYVRGDVGKGWWAPITVADKRIDSPYNTYKYQGLPPHPIANPGLAAIDAALHPAETECLYYLHDANHEIHCAVTYEAHRKNIDTYLRGN